MDVVSDAPFDGWRLRAPAVVDAFICGGCSSAHRPEKLRREIEPFELALDELETERDVSAVETAAFDVSKIEGRDDPTLSVLSRTVAAKGGRLRLEVETADGDELRFVLTA